MEEVKKLIIPLYIYNLAYGIIVYFLKQKGFNIGERISFYSIVMAPILDGHQFVYNMGGWFMTPFFLLETGNAVFRKLLKARNPHIHEGVFFCFSLLFGVIGNTLACKGYLEDFWLVLVRTLYFSPFYGLGILYKRVLEKYERRIQNIWYFMGIFGVQLLIIFHYGRILTYTPSWCNDFQEGPVMPIIVGYLGIALWMRVSTILEPVVGKSKWINLIADNTYSIAMNQFLGFMIIKGVFALISKADLAFPDFDWIRFKTDIWWYYKPRGLQHMMVVYVANGILFSIVVQKGIDYFKQFMGMVKNRVRKHRI